MEPVDETQPSDVRPPSRAKRARLWAAAMQERGRRYGDRAQAERSRHASVDAVFEMVDRDGEVAGGIIAGALAYRLFIWLLPLGLVAVAGLGIAADASSESPEKAAGQIGLLGLVTSSISDASKSSNRYYALAIGIPILIYVTRSVLRVLIGSHRLVWRDLRSAVPRPTIAASLELLGLFAALFVAYGLSRAVGRHTDGLVGVVVTLVMTLPYAGVWLLISKRLPHRGAPWQALVPGALLFGRRHGGDPRGCRVLHRAVLAREAGHLRRARGRGRAPARALLLQPADRRRGDRQCDAVGATGAAGTAGA